MQPEELKLVGIRVGARPGHVLRARGTVTARAGHFDRTVDIIGAYAGR